MSFANLKAASYVLVHTPDMVIHNGTTQTQERAANPESDYLKQLPNHLRSYEEVVNYAPNQTYIGNTHHSELNDVETPWYEHPIEGKRYSNRGEIMPQKEFYGLLSLVDVFDLVYLEESYAEEVREILSESDLFKDDVDKIKKTESAEWLQKQIDENEAEGLYEGEDLVGVVIRAHDSDENLSAHIMLENLVSKASGILSVRHLLKDNDIDPAEIDYVIECSEEAVGDINQRGGGNLAKAIAELSGLPNANGSDLRGFCAAPTHALVTAASHVKAETFKNVIVVAGGSTAKLGMNGKSHIGKEMPVLEDALAGVAFLVGQDDGHSPVIRTDYIGRHTVSSGSSPQAVTQALIGSALDKADITVEGIDAYSVEMQNPDITKPAGAGDVPTANLKMIGAIGVMRKEIDRKELPTFVSEKLIPGWAPTQGHIPSGVPYLGFAIDDLTTGDFNRAMIVGKGSLFLGRMTNLFDGISVILERNNGKGAEDNTSADTKELVRSEVAQALREFAQNFKVE